MVQTATDLRPTETAPAAVLRNAAPGCALGAPVEPLDGGCPNFFCLEALLDWIERSEWPAA